MNLSPVLKHRYFDADGNPLAGGKLYSYQAGTTTPQATYTDAGGGTPNPNPVVLDANGEATIWLDPELSYKFVLTDADDVQQWTIDGVVGILTPGSVNTASIADEAVTTAKLDDGAVTTPKLDDEAVTRAKLAVGAIGRLKIITKTDNYTLTENDDVIAVDASSGAFTLTLPSASSVPGKRYWVIKSGIDSSFNPVTLAGVTTVNTSMEAVQVVSDGEGWAVLDRHIPGHSTAWAPAHTWGENATALGTWIRRGNYFKGRVEISLSGSPTDASLTLSLPAGLEMDPTEVSPLLPERFGFATFYDHGTGVLNGVVSVAAGSYTNVEVLYFYAVAQGLTQTTLSATQPFTWANNDKVIVSFEVPINGWHAS